MFNEFNAMQWKYNLFKRKVDNFVKTIQWLLMLSFLVVSSIKMQNALKLNINLQSAQTMCVLRCPLVMMHDA